MRLCFVTEALAHLGFEFKQQNWRALSRYRPKHARRHCHIDSSLAITLPSR